MTEIEVSQFPSQRLKLVHISCGINHPLKRLGFELLREVDLHETVVYWNELKKMLCGAVGPLADWSVVGLAVPRRKRHDVTNSLQTSDDTR